jgi:ketosteroid isomerase-like protein
MSQENVELHRRAIEAFNARDIEKFIAYCDRRVEWNSTFAAIGGAVYHGHDGIRKWDREWREIWGDEIRAEPEAYFDLGEHTVAFYLLHGRGRQSGAQVTLHIAAVARWRNGLIISFKGYAHREDAFTDLGVSQDALDPIAP